jgi:hypothetical protein
LGVGGEYSSREVKLAFLWAMEEQVPSKAMQLSTGSGWPKRVSLSCPQPKQVGHNQTRFLEQTGSPSGEYTGKFGRYSPVCPPGSHCQPCRSAQKPRPRVLTPLARDSIGQGNRYPAHLLESGLRRIDRRSCCATLTRRCRGGGLRLSPRPQNDQVEVHP